MNDDYKFGDVVEWPTGQGMARWFIVCGEPKAYQALWLGDPAAPQADGELHQIGARHTPDETLLNA